MMKTKLPPSRWAIAFLAMEILSGCATSSDVEDATKDKFAYQEKNFSLRRLSPSIRNKLPEPPVRSGSGPEKLVVVREGALELINGKKLSWTMTTTFTDIGQGLVQRIEEQSYNGSSMLRVYSLTYLGFLDLRWQYVPLMFPTTSVLFEVNDILRFDPLPDSGSGEAVIDYTRTVGGRKESLIPGQKTCTAVGTVQASRLHVKLEGLATGLECTHMMNHVLQNREKWVFLERYGTAVLMESADSIGKKTYRITDIQVL